MNSPQFFKIESREENASPGMLLACAPPIRQPIILNLNRVQDYEGFMYIMLQTKGRKWMDFVTPRDCSSPLVCSQAGGSNGCRGGLDQLPGILGRIFN